MYCAVCPTAVKTTVPAVGRMAMDFSALQPASERTTGNARIGNKDAKRRGIIRKSPAAKLLSACGRAPFHFSQRPATFVRGVYFECRGGPPPSPVGYYFGQSLDNIAVLRLYIQLRVDGKRLASAYI